MTRNIRVGTRGSDLALAQTGLVIKSLEEANPGFGFERVIISTRGDLDQASPLTRIGYGVFVSELESALSGGEVDIAVHSLKDMPSRLGDGFEIAAVPYREDPRDVLISRSGAPMADLPFGARVGTGSARRKSLLLDRRPDFKVEQLRGNVPTRLAKLDAEDGPDAIVLAAAGLKRIGLEGRITEYLACHDFVSAVGQGALAIEVRAGDEATAVLVRPLQHDGTRTEVDAERAFLATVEGGCSAPVSAHAKARNGQISINAFAGLEDGSRVLRGSRNGAAADGVALAKDLADELLRAGAADLLRVPTDGAK
jgi:hydroxymethylbilane synthase